MIDENRFRPVFEAYKSKIQERWTEEKMKWETIKQFQDNWNLEVEDFRSMINKSIMNNTLFSSPQNLVRPQLLQIAEIEPNTLREMFRKLYNENLDLKERIDYFCNTASKLVETGKIPGPNSYLDIQAASLLLWAMYPEKYVIYRPRIASKASKTISDGKIKGSVSGNKFDNYQRTMILYSEIATKMSNDPDFVSETESILGDTYPDCGMNTWAVDFGYYIYQNDDKGKSEGPSENNSEYWVLQMNPKNYDHKLAFEEMNGLINWSRSPKFKNVHKNDIVYLYNTDTKRIEYKCEVIQEKVDESEWNNDEKYRKSDKLGPNEDPFVIQKIAYVEDERLNLESLIRIGYVNARNSKKIGDLKIIDYMEGIFAEYIDGEPGKPNCKKKVLEQLFIDEKELEMLVETLKEKKNLILSGPPGVGKTFVARRLAYYMMGNKDKNKVKFIQFHQNYSYEDFVIGYKPNGSGFELEKGVFHKWCTIAGNDKPNYYFLIIDEINRGNTSKIFGELLMAIENNYRGEEVDLAYGKDEKLAVPDNLFIIGTMNTADRSIAMIDYALRRRFSFYDMKPAFNTDKFKKYAISIENQHYHDLVKTILELNDEIKNDSSLGEGFEVGHSYLCSNKPGYAALYTDDCLRRIIKMDIIPIVKEYWFDNSDCRNKWTERLKNVVP